MLFSSIPAKFQIPWGNGAGGGFIRTVPQASQIAVTPGAASLTDGFPPLNFQPVGSGGVPPFGQDMNGILKQITQWNQWQGAGGTPQYDATFSAAVGGYPQGAIISSTQAGFLWYNTVDNNTTNPDNRATAVGWVPIIIANPSPVIYVRTDGNDNNNGSANNSANALLTIGAAISRISSAYYSNGQTVTIQLGNTGSYPIGTGLNIQVAGGSITIKGDPANQGLYGISGAGPGGGSALIAAANACNLTLNGVTVSCSGAGSANVAAIAGGSLTLQNVTFGTTISNTALMLASIGGSITINAGCIISGGSGSIFNCIDGGMTMTANINVSGAFAWASAACVVNTCGTFTVVNSAVFTGSACTGPRYSAALNGVINTNGGGANFFPGSVAGATATGGQYA